jgi:hypothetical protein
MLQKHLFGFLFFSFLSTANVSRRSIIPILEICLSVTKRKHFSYIDEWVLLSCTQNPHFLFQLRGGCETLNNDTALRRQNSSITPFQESQSELLDGLEDGHDSSPSSIRATNFSSPIASLESPHKNGFPFSSELWKVDKLHKMNRTSLIAILRKHGNFTCQRLKKSDLVQQIIQHQSSFVSMSRLQDTYGSLSPGVSPLPYAQKSATEPGQDPQDAGDHMDLEKCF